MSRFIWPRLEATLRIISKSTDQTAITIRNYNDLNNVNQLTNYLTDTFADLDAANHDDQQKNFLEDTSLGFTVEERQAKLNNTKKVAIAYNA